MVFGLFLTLAALAATVTIPDSSPVLRVVSSIAAGFGGLGIWKSALAKRTGEAALIGYSVVDYLDRGEEIGSSFRGHLAELIRTQRCARVELP
jgi:hypothetical protein